VIKPPKPNGAERLMSDFDSENQVSWTKHRIRSRHVDAWRSLAHEDYFGNTSILRKGTGLLLGHARMPGYRDARFRRKLPP
jgi:hypothetical protein